MRRAIAGFLMVLVLSLGSTVFALGDNLDPITSGGGGAVLARPVAMPKSQFCSNCQMASNNYLKTGNQPPTLTRIADARAAVRISTQTLRVDRLLKAHWPGGYPAGGITVVPD